jgi:hypothetical protein
MQLHLESKRKKLETIQHLYPDVQIIDVTSKGPLPWQKFSPFFPHGEIPVPHSGDVYAFSVEGIWQGLKVFENEGIDVTKFEITNMKGIKRTVRKHGNVLGHQKGVYGSALISYIEARKSIYLPAYNWVLENRLSDEFAELLEMAKNAPLVFLDYETNTNVEDPRKPLSHGSLVIEHLRKLSK